MSKWKNFENFLWSFTVFHASMWSNACEIKIENQRAREQSDPKSHYSRYSAATPLTQCLLSEAFETLVCQDHLSKQHTPSPSRAGLDSALGNGNWQQPAWQTHSLTESWIWARALITAPFSTLFPLLMLPLLFELRMRCSTQHSSIIPLTNQCKVFYVDMAFCS